MDDIPNTLASYFLEPYMNIGLYLISPSLSYFTGHILDLGVKMNDVAESTILPPYHHPLIATSSTPSCLYTTYIYLLHVLCPFYFVLTCQPSEFLSSLLFHYSVSEIPRAITLTCSYPKLCSRFDTCDLYIILFI